MQLTRAARAYTRDIAVTSLRDGVFRAGGDAHGALLPWLRRAAVTFAAPLFCGHLSPVIGQDGQVVSVHVSVSCDF